MNKPQGKVSCTWSSELAYAIGLIVTDGCLQNDGRHINLTSKDIDQLETFAGILGLKNKIGEKSSSYSKDKIYYQIQFGDVLFYRFLESIGIHSRKTKTIGKVNIPDEYFGDFLRGHLDGDGHSRSFYDPVWKKSFRIYTEFCSASERHVVWIHKKLTELLGLRGFISYGSSVFRLRYTKKDSLSLYKYMYYKKSVPCLERKRAKIMKAIHTNTLVSKLV